MLSNQVRECLRHGEECMQQALAQTDLKLRRDYLIIAGCWLKLSQELSELPPDFSEPARQAAQAQLNEGREERISMAR